MITEIVILITALIIFLILYHLNSRKEAKALLEERKEYNFETFISSFSDDDVNDKVIKAVYRKMATSTITYIMLKEEFPVLATDTLIEDWAYDEEGELDDLIEEIQSYLGIDGKVSSEGIETVRDLVLSINKKYIA